MLCLLVEVVVACSGSVMNRRRGEGGISLFPSQGEKRNTALETCGEVPGTTDV